MIRPVALVALLSLCVSFPVPIIIDTDIGDDFDDSWALTEALSRPDLWDVKMVLTAAKNTPARAQIVAKYLTEYKRTDIPIGIGVQTSNAIGRLYEWAKDVDLHTYNMTGGTVYDDGVKEAARMLMQQSTANPIRFVAIAPTSNFETLVKDYPSAIPQVEGLYAMFGAVDYCYGHKKINTPGSCPEYNDNENLTASWTMFNASWPITITPLDTCDYSMSGAPWEALLDRNTTAYPMVQTLMTSYCWWKGFQDCNSTTSDTLYDPTAMWMSRDTALFNMQYTKLALNEHGGLLRDSDGRYVDIALTWKTNGLDTFHNTLSQWIIDHQI